MRLRFLITAGPTREYIDSVRYLSNESSGKMGFALAAEAAARGHEVTLIHGPVAIAVPEGVRGIAVGSAADMLAACLKAWPRADVLIKAAAVADYRPTLPSKTKLKKSRDTLVLKLKPTQDILATLAASRKPGQVAIGFALEDANARANAETKLQRKKLDAIVLNRPTALSADRSTIDVLVRDTVWQPPRTGTKSTLAKSLIAMAESLASAPTHAPTHSISRSRATKPRRVP